MASRHKVVKLRSKNRHDMVTPPPRSEPQAHWQLDLDNERLRRGGEAIALPLKAFAVLRYLHEHPGRLVTKQELLDAVWPDVAVTEAVLKNCILKLREALGDDAKAPQYIETVHRRGYCLLTPLAPLHPFNVPRSTFQACRPLRTQDSALSTQSWWGERLNWRNCRAG
jgi:DNA-binding winged helix-turn-helix (wHTH) protein